MSMTLNPKSVNVTDAGETLLEASAARTEIILTNAGANNAFLCIGTDAVVDKGIILYAYSNLSLSKKASRQKITAICDSAETATITIQEI